jgi:predicted kinase
MEAVILIGIQAVGKSTFYKQRYFKTHMRLNLDMLKTRHREDLFLQTCIEGKQPFVVDNTNLTVEARVRYISVAKAVRFQIAGYYFQSAVQDSLHCNQERVGKERVPDIAILSAHKQLQLPTYEEGFDTLYYVKMEADGGFLVSEWNNEL